MHRHVQNEFIDLFPSGSLSSSGSSNGKRHNYNPPPVANVNSPIRTSVSDIMNMPQPVNMNGLTSGHWSNADKQRLSNELNNPPRYHTNSNRVEGYHNGHGNGHDHGHNHGNGHNHNHAGHNHNHNNNASRPKSQEAFTPPAQSVKSGTKKIILSLVIAILGAFIFSAIAYTFSDNIFGKFGVAFFAEDGQPKLPIILLHTLLFAILIFLALWIAKC